MMFGWGKCGISSEKHATWKAFRSLGWIFDAPIIGWMLFENMSFARDIPHFSDVYVCAALLLTIMSGWGTCGISLKKSRNSVLLEGFQKLRLDLWRTDHWLHRTICLLKTYTIVSLELLHKLKYKK